MEQIYSHKNWEEVKLKKAHAAMVDPPEELCASTPNGEGSLPKRNRGRRSTPEAPYGDRLRALRDVLGFPTQQAFRQEVGLEYNQYNNIESGKANLSREVADAIFLRFRRVSLEFLFHGLAGYGDRHIEDELLRWERRTGKKIFR